MIHEKDESAAGTGVGGVYRERARTPTPAWKVAMRWQPRKQTNNLMHPCRRMCLHASTSRAGRASSSCVPGMHQPNLVWGVKQPEQHAGTHFSRNGPAFEAEAGVTCFELIGENVKKIQFLRQKWGSEGGGGEGTLVASYGGA